MGRPARAGRLALLHGGAIGTVRSVQACFHPQGYLPSQLRVRRGTANTVPFEDIRSGTGSGFRFAAEAFAKVVAEASLDNAATLEALAQSARLGRAVEVAARAG